MRRREPPVTTETPLADLPERDQRRIAHMVAQRLRIILKVDIDGPAASERPEDAFRRILAAADEAGHGSRARQLVEHGRRSTALRRAQGWW